MKVSLKCRPPAGTTGARKCRTRCGTFYGVDAGGEIAHMAYHEKCYRHAVDARRSFDYGGGACTLLVLRRSDTSVELLFHATPETGAVLTVEQTVELAKALTDANQ